MPAAHPLERRSTFKLPRRKDQNWWFPPKVSLVAMAAKSASTSISVKIFGYPVDETGTSHSITGFDELSFCFLTLSGDENR